MTHTDDKTDKTKTDEMFKIYHTSANVYLLVPASKMSGKYVPKLLNNMLAKANSWKEYIILDNVYKMEYDAYDDVDILTTRNSFVKSEQVAWL